MNAAGLHVAPGGRIGRWSALSVFIIDALYVLTGVLWLISRYDPALHDPLAPVDPYRAILEALIILSAPPMVVTMAAVHTQAPGHRKTCSLAALMFTSLLAGITCGVHFIEITVTRRIDPAALPGLSRIFTFEWPSAVFALDLLAWDLFLGLSMLFAAPVFRGGGLRGWIRGGMILGGSLCIVGLLGPVSGDLRFQLPAIVGYAGVFPVVCLLLAILFGRPDRHRETAPQADAGSGSLPA